MAVHCSLSESQFKKITNKIRNRLTCGITKDRINCITGPDWFTNIKCFGKLANTAAVTYVTFSHIIRTDIMG